jgi:mannose-6-phosphate isomerase class I
LYLIIEKCKEELYYAFHEFLLLFTFRTQSYLRQSRLYQKTEQMTVLQQAKDRNNDDEKDKNLRNKKFKN